MYKIFAYWSAPRPEDAEAFEEHYLNVHCPIAAKVPGIKRLILTRPSGFEGAESLHYRVAELGWDSQEALEECEKSEEWAALRATQARWWSASASRSRTRRAKRWTRSRHFRSALPPRLARRGLGRNEGGLGGCETTNWYFLRAIARKKLQLV